MESLKKAFGVGSKQPFLFVWGSLLFIFMFLVILFAALGVFLAYFIFLTVFDQPLSFESIPTLGVLAIIGLIVVVLTSGINASLAMTYNSALAKKKVSLAKFYTYALDIAHTVFGILLIRELIWLLMVGPFIAIYVYVLHEYQYMDILLGIYAFFMTFILHMLFTPAFIIAGALGAPLFESLKRSFTFLQKKHVFFMATYILFAFIWLFNFIPFIQIATIFFLYPLVYSSMIIMIKDNIKITREEEDY